MDLRHIYWIGGGTSAGKSTIARRLADEHRLRLYSTDDVMAEHATRTTAVDAPYLHEFLAMDMNERWVRRTPEVMLETFHWFRGEGFGLIVEDLLRLPTDRGIVVEGFRLLPRLVAPLLAHTSQAVWLLPTREFQERAYASRGSTWHIPGRTTDPERARQNLHERDRRFTERVAHETEQLGLVDIRVEPGMSEHDLAAKVARGFRL